jgi:phage-related protein
VPWKIIFYSTSDNETPVQEFVDALPVKQQEKILRSLSLLGEFGTGLRDRNVEHLEDALWELRTKFGTDIFRSIYFLWTNERFVILHSFRKKKQKTPLQDLETARRRLDDWLARHQEK